MKLRRTAIAAALVLIASTLAPTALAHGPRVRVVAPHHHRHVYSYGHVSVRPRVVRVHRVNYGTVDFNVRPQRSRVYVDGDYLGIADDFNGYPQKARLAPGRHVIRVVSPAGQVEVRRIYVAAGREFNFNLQF